MADVLEDSTNELATLVRLAIQRARLSWLEIERHIAWCDGHIRAHVRTDA